MLTPEQIQPRGALVLVRRYERPEKIGSIWVPDEARYDDTLSLWEVVRSGPGVAEVLGTELEPDDIVATPPRVGSTFLESLVPGFDPRYAFVGAQHIINTIRWKEPEA